MEIGDNICQVSPGFFLWTGEGAILSFTLCLRIICGIFRVELPYAKLTVLNKVIGNFPFGHHMYG